MRLLAAIVIALLLWKEEVGGGGMKRVRNCKRSSRGQDSDKDYMHHHRLSGSGGMVCVMAEDKGGGESLNSLTSITSAHLDA